MLGVVVVASALAVPGLAQASDVWPSGPRLHFSTTGVPVWGSPVVPGASTSAGGGAALMNATRTLNIGGVSIPVSLSRNVPVSNVARVLAVGSRFMGVLAVAGLAYEGVRWLNDEWMKDLPATDAELGGFYWRATSYTTECPAPSGSLEQCMTTVAEMEAMGLRRISAGGVTVTRANDSLYRVCSVSQTWFCADVVKTAVAVPLPDPVPATDEDLQISFQQGLIEAPSMAPTLLDLALQDSRARAALLADAMQLNGPATVEGPTTTTTEVAPGGNTTINRSVTYNVTYQGDVVTITETTTTTRTDPENNVTTTTTVTALPTGSEPQAAAEAEDLECGLPGTPKCAIDEAGTPDGAGLDAVGMDAISSGSGAIEDGIRGVGDAPITDLGIGLDVDLPGGSCTPLVLSFKGFTKATNWCPALGVARDIWGWGIGILGALYVFRRATNPMA